MGCCGEDINNKDKVEIKNKGNDENKINIKSNKNGENIKNDGNTKNNFKKFDFYQDLLEDILDDNSYKSEEVSYEHLLEKNKMNFIYVLGLFFNKNIKYF